MHSSQDGATALFLGDALSIVTLLRKSAKATLSAVPLADGMFRRHVWSHRHFPEVEMEAINRFPAGTFDVAVDVGAAQGLFTWILSRKARRVHAFEPGAALGRLMRWATPLSNVTFHPKAVGDKAGAVSLFTPASGLFGATVSQSSPVAHAPRVAINEVEQVSLDGALAATLAEGGQVDFIKIDVEGYEISVLYGATDVLRRCHPALLCEIESRHNPDTARVFSDLRALGYRCHVVEDGRLRPFEDADVQAVQQDRANPALPYLNNFLFQHPQSRVDVARLMTMALAELR